MSIGKPDLAIAAANIAIEKLPSDKKELLAQTYFARSFAYLALQDTTARIADLTQAIALTPDEMLYYKVRASDYSNMGQYAEADRDFDKMIELDEGFIHAYIGKGHILLKQQQYEEAIKVFEYVTKLDPTYAYGYGFLATAYSWLGRDQEALDNIMLALQINYDRWALNFMMNAALGPYKTDVIARFKTMSLKEPQNAYWDYYTGHVYLAHEEYAQALEAFKAAYEKDPDKEIARWIAECQAKLEK